VLKSENPLRERLRCVVRFYLESGLSNDWSFVKIRRHEVNRAPMNTNTCGKRSIMGIQTRKSWDDGGMNVDNPIREAIDNARCQDSHETCEDNKIGV